MLSGNIIPLLCFLIPTTLVQLNEVPGGWSEVNVNDPTVRNISMKAVQLYSASTNIGFAMRLVKVIQAEKQVVSGFNYNLTLIVGLLGCSFQEATLTPSQCTIEKVNICKFKVYVQPWTNTFHLTTSSCSGFTSAWAPISANSRVIKKSTKAALRQIMSHKSNARMIKMVYLFDTYFNKWVPKLFRIYMHLVVRTNIEKKMKIHVTVKSNENAYKLLFCKISKADLTNITKCTTDNYSV